MYIANEKRYDNRMKFKKCGNSGLYLPLVSLGLWQNFGEETPLKLQKEKLFKTFDLGITHFDLANNYGRPVDGSAEENFGRILKSDLMRYRDELIISTKAGYDMGVGRFGAPYHNGGSRKYLISSLDQSLKRMGLEYVDIFYHHRPDFDTPLEETMGALADIVKQGKALYVGISNYKKDEAEKAIEILKELKVPCLINQIRYNMLERWSEDGLLELLNEKGVGCICYSPLAQGALSNKYLNSIPEDSRAKLVAGTSIAQRYLDEKHLNIIAQLNNLANDRGQTLAQMALAWILRRQEVTSVLIGASKVEQIVDNVSVLNKLEFSKDELNEIEKILKGIAEI